MTQRSQSRKHRGIRTQALLAQRWQANGIFPYATDAGPGRPGVDILNTPGVRCEVKARTKVSLEAELQKLKDGSDDLRILVWRHDGQGEKSMDEWTVTLPLAQFERMFCAYHVCNPKEDGDGADS